MSAAANEGDGGVGRGDEGSERDVTRGDAGSERGDEHAQDEGEMADGADRMASSALSSVKVTGRQLTWRMQRAHVKARSTPTMGTSTRLKPRQRRQQTSPHWERHHKYEHLRGMHGLTTKIKTS